MGLNWPAITSGVGDLAAADQRAIRELLDEFADRGVRHMEALSLPRTLHPSGVPGAYGWFGTPRRWPLFFPRCTLA